MRLLWIEGDPGQPAGSRDPYAGLTETVARRLRGILEGEAPVTMPATALAVPAVRQREGYSCGPAVLLAVLQFFGRLDDAARERILYRPLKTDTAKGTDAAQLVDLAVACGLQAEVRVGMTIDGLRRLSAEDGVAILGIQAAGGPDDCEFGHYVVFLGADADPFGRAYLMDPLLGHSFVDLPDLQAAWRVEDDDGTCREGLAVVVRAPDGAFPRATHVPSAAAQALPRSKTGGTGVWRAQPTQGVPGAPVFMMQPGAGSVPGAVAEGKAIGTSGSHRDGDMTVRDARLRAHGPGRFTLPQHLRLASKNTVRALEPITEEARKSIGMLLRMYLGGGIPYERLQQESTKRWREAYERVREVGRRASALDRLHPTDSAILPAEETWFRSAVREELQFWQLLLDELQEGALSEARLWDRFEAYLRALRFMYESARVLALPDTVLLYWMGPKKDDPRICDGCAYMVERSPFPKHKIPAVPLDGTTPCLTNCRHWIVARAATPVDVAERWQALPSRETMLRQLRERKEHAHGTHRRERAQRHARAHAHRPQVHNPFHGERLPRQRG